MTKKLNEKTVFALVLAVVSLITVFSVFSLTNSTMLTKTVITCIILAPTLFAWYKLLK